MDVVIEQHSFAEDDKVGNETTNLNVRKLLSILCGKWPCLSVILIQKLAVHRSRSPKTINAGVYGENGIRSGSYQQSNSVELLVCTCQELIQQKAELIIPGFTELSIVAKGLRVRGIPIIDVNQVYAQYAVDINDITDGKAFRWTTGTFLFCHKHDRIKTR